MEYKYCLIRQDDYSGKNECNAPICVENVYFYTLNDLKTYIADDLYMFAQLQSEKISRERLYDKLRNFAKYVVLNPKYNKPANKISYHHLYECTHLYINNEGVQKDKSLILANIKAHDICWEDLCWWRLLNICVSDYNVLERELIPYVERVIHSLIYGTFDKNLQVNYTYPPVKMKIKCSPMWYRPKSYIRHHCKICCHPSSHQYIREKAVHRDPEIVEYINSRQRLRSKAYFTNNAGNCSSGWKSQHKCRKAWAKHEKNPQYVSPTDAVYDIYMQEWMDNKK